MLEKIEYIFPVNSKSIEFFDLLSALLQDIPYVAITEKEIHIISSNLKPETVFRLDSNIHELQLNIQNEKYSNLLNRSSKKMEEECVQKLSIKEVMHKLKGHITRVDHTGVNLPSIIYSKEEWHAVCHYLASVSNLYLYPTGEPWPFLLPCTEKENENEITNFETLREPRFELVFDEYTHVPVLQIDIETDLSKSEVEALFPKEQGIYFENLANVFKSIYLDYDESIDIRLDVRFKGPFGDFESGKWIVIEGKRIHTI